MRSHALGVKGAAGVGPNRAPAGIWKPMTRPAPATAAVSRNSRRVTLEEARMLRLLRRAMDGGADPLIGPQRQMFVITVSMSASEGCGFFASSAAAAMIWPDWQ